VGNKSMNSRKARTINPQGVTIRPSHAQVTRPNTISGKVYDLVVVNKKDRVSADAGTMIWHAVGQDVKWSSRGSGVTYTPATPRQQMRRYARLQVEHAGRWSKDTTSQLLVTPRVTTTAAPALSV
jgi:hypothetical protein